MRRAGVHPFVIKDPPSQAKCPRVLTRSRVGEGARSLGASSTRSINEFLAHLCVFTLRQCVSPNRTCQSEPPITGHASTFFEPIRRQETQNRATRLDHAPLRSESERVERTFRSSLPWAARATLAPPDGCSESPRDPIWVYGGSSARGTSIAETDGDSRRRSRRLMDRYCHKFGLTERGQLFSRHLARAQGGVE